MSKKTSMTLLTARWIVPIASEPIENGWVQIEDGIIVEMGGGKPRALREAPLLHLGESALFPGLINCHAHLEFEQGDHPHDSFAKWATSVQDSQQDADTTAIWQHNLKRLLATGTTTVVNHGNLIPTEIRRGDPCDRPHPAATERANTRFAPTPNIIQICEFVGASAENGALSYRHACEQRLKLLESGLMEDVVVSPHSLYAVSPVVWEEFINHRRGGSPCPPADGISCGPPRGGAPTKLISIHLKESAEEDRLFREGKGPLAQLVKKRGGLLWQHDPVGWLKEKQLLGPKTLLIHGNYLNERDVAHLQGTGASVIHCPGSHSYFGHQYFPLDALQEHKIRVALGTDSLASNDDLSMLREMRLFRRGGSPCPPADDISCGPPRGGAPTTQELIQMATINGAEALGITDTRGTLEPDKWADMIGLKMGSWDNPYEALFNADQVNMTMVRGRIVHQDGI